MFKSAARFLTSCIFSGVHDVGAGSFTASFAYRASPQFAQALSTKSFLQSYTNMLCFYGKKKSSFAKLTLRVTSRNTRSKLTKVCCGAL